MGATASDMISSEEVDVKLKMTSAIAIALSLAAVANSASAATVGKGWTRPNHAGGIVALELTTQSRQASGAYDDFADEQAAYGLTAADSHWVWAATNSGEIMTNNKAVYEYRFDSTRYNVDDMMIQGFWGVDNYGYMTLNGVDLTGAMAGVSGTELEWAGTGTNHHASSTAFSISGSSYFVEDGENVLTFTLFDQDFLTHGLTGGSSYGAFHAILEVTASEVPLPAGAWLGLSGLAMLAGVGRRRRKAA